jgi:hypothetical protein
LRHGERSIFRCPVSLIDNSSPAKNRAACCTSGVFGRACSLGTAVLARVPPHRHSPIQRYVVQMTF